MTSKQIEAYRFRLSEILRTKEPPKRQELLALAKEVGASTSHWAKIGGDNDATESQLVFNIQTALQTASMIDACRTSAKNYEIAVIATEAVIKNYWIAVAIAILAMLAAWVAVLVSN